MRKRLLAALLLSAALTTPVAAEETPAPAGGVGQCAPGLGIGLLPQASLEQQARFPNLVSVPLDEPWATRVSYLAVSTRTMPTAASEALLRAMGGALPAAPQGG